VCNIFNSKQASTLKLVKTVDHGQGQPSDWTLTASGTTNGFSDAGNSSTFHTVSANIPYTLSESSSSPLTQGYSQFGAWTCTGGYLQGNNITLNPGQNVTCTVDNHRDTGSVKVNKKTDLNGDGDWNDSHNEGSNQTDANNYANGLGFRWILDGGGSNLFGATVSNLDTTISNYWHTLDEYVPAGYRFVSWYINGTGKSCTNPDGRTLPLGRELQVNKNSVTEITVCNKKDFGSISGYKWNDVNGNTSKDSDEEKLSGWQIYVDANNSGQKDGDELSATTDANGNYTINNVPMGSYSIREVNKAGWKETWPYHNSYSHYVTIDPSHLAVTDINFGNQKNPIIVKAYKVVCDSESKLPNWGNNSAPNITASTAQTYVNTHPGCQIQSDWDFQYGFGEKSGNPGVQRFGNGNQTGLAPVGTGYNDWKTLGTTSGSNPAEINVNDLQGSDRIWVRENLQSEYVPFSYPPGSQPGNSYSAELYCHTDGNV
jgi:hypothetical protein